MSNWIPYKASPVERQNKNRYKNRQRACRVCGKPVDGAGNTCRSCRQFLSYMSKKEGATNERKEKGHS